MKIEETKLQGLLIVEPDIFSDDRGYFFEPFNRDRYEKAGISKVFVQDNISFSKRGILRGLHFQYPQAQGKLVQAVHGSVWDVAVDIRVNSPTFGQWIGEELSDSNHKQMYIPPGFAHGFCVLSETAIFSYKCTDYYNPRTENGIIWNDTGLNIDWPIANPILSQKDNKFNCLKDIPIDRLPKYLEP